MHSKGVCFQESGVMSHYPCLGEANNTHVSFFVERCSFFAMHEIWVGNTVDGRNPAPPGMVKAV